MLKSLILIFSLVGSMAQAGAWPRAEGSFFVSLSHRIGFSTTHPLTTKPSQYTTFYAEYGVTPKLTLGLDSGRSVSGAGKVIVFARWPLLQAENGHMFGLEVGVGKIDGDNVVRPGLSYGYGFSRRGLGGWIAADAVAEIRVDTDATDVKLDLTYGLSWPGGIKAYTQIQSGQEAGEDVFARIAGAVVLPNRLGFSTEFGLEYGVYGDDALQVKMGVWREF